MKTKLFSFVLLCAFAVTAAADQCPPPAGKADKKQVQDAVTLTDGATAVSNGKITLEYTDGIVKVTAPGLKTLAATIRVNLKSETLKTSTLVNPARKFHMLSLRGPDGSIAFKVEGRDARFSVSHAINASPIVVTWDAAAVVIPDKFAEDEVLLPGSEARNLPPFAPLYLALQEGENSTLACIPVKAKSPAVLSADFKTLTLSLKNNEHYVFFLNTGKGAWHKTALPAKPGEFKTVDDWEPPYKLQWQVALPLAEDFVPAGNGAWSVWNIITVTDNPKQRPRNLPVRAVMVDRKTRNTWHGGFEGTYRYPAEFVDGKLKLLHQNFKNKIVYDAKIPVFIYAWKPWSDPVAVPQRYLPPWVSNQGLYGSTNTGYGMKATTCNVTQLFEKIFYRDEAEQKVGEIAAMLKSMQCFVENIRGRIESGREWREEMLKFSADMRKLHPELAPDADKLDAAVNEIDRQYNLNRERIKTPPEVEAMGQEVLKLAVSKIDADEKEEKAKQLGRAIRTVGGTQDNMIARFRHVGKCVRHIAVVEYTTAKTPEAREFWAEAYRRTETLLQGYFCDGK
jgi:hypothetical protein